jgi:hypothetical protein
MSILSSSACKNPLVDSSISSFFLHFGLKEFMKLCNFKKEKGLPPLEILLYFISSIFTHKSLSELEQDNSLPCGKSSLYRFLDSYQYRWRKLLFIFAVSFFMTFLKPLKPGKKSDKESGTKSTLPSVLIVDDSPYPRNRGKKAELEARKFDHCTNQYFNGYELLTVGIFDGQSFLPLKFSLQSSQDKSKRLQEARDDLDKRTHSARLRAEAIMGKPAVLLSLLKEIRASEIDAKHILFDSWFASNKLLGGIMDLGYQPVCRVKEWNAMKFTIDGKGLTLQELYKKVRFCLNRSSKDIMGSVTVEVGKDAHGDPREGKVIFIRNRNKSKRHWLAILNTDMTLSDQEAVRLYGMRWDIEVFFKVCKSVLRMTKEMSLRNFNALVAHITIVFLRYILLCYENRLCKDERSYGGIFLVLCDELEDISLKQAIELLFSYLETAAQVKFLSPERLKELFDVFMAELAKSLRHYPSQRSILNVAA